MIPAGVIASGYARGGKRVHLFELDVPALETLGWTLQEARHTSSERQPSLARVHWAHTPPHVLPRAASLQFRLFSHSHSPR